MKFFNLPSRSISSTSSPSKMCSSKILPTFFMHPIFLPPTSLLLLPSSHCPTISTTFHNQDQKPKSQNFQTVLDVLDTDTHITTTVTTVIHTTIYTDTNTTIPTFHHIPLHQLSTYNHIQPPRTQNYILTPQKP